MGPRGAVLLATAISLAIWGIGCASPTPLTELVVRVDLAAGLEPGRDVGSIDLQAVVDGATTLEMRVTTTSRAAVPLTFGLTSASGHASMVVLTAVANDTSGAPVVSRTVRTHFLHDERRLVEVLLEPLCRGVTCNGTEQTCIGGTCLNEFVDPNTLPSFSGTLADAGIIDAGAPPHDVGTDAYSCYADAGVTGQPDGCVPHRPPTRPSCGTGTDGMTRTFALIDPGMDQSHNVWATASYDLDGLCTDPLVPGPSECQVAVDTPGDGPGGTDNAFGEVVLMSLLTFAPSYATDVSEAANQGLGVPLVQLAEWNGRADDDRVSVVIATSVDVLPSSVMVPASMVTVMNSYPPPNWDGMDTAYPAGNYFTGIGMVPQIYDDNAFVSNHVLVAALPDRAPFDIPSHITGTGSGAANGIVRIRLTDTRFVATLSADGTSLTNSVIVGRWAYSDIVGYLPAIGICPGTRVNNQYIAAFDIVLHRALDLRSMPGSGGAGVPCDALSLALPFQRGVSVHWGGITPIMLTPGTCP